jgi:2,5-furandicarboxylate decarboxylase 1
LRDLRDWLTMLDGAGALVTAQPRVPLEFGVLGLIERYEGKAACFLPRPGGHPVPIAGGTIGRREWIGMALGVPPSAVLHRVGAAVANPIDWQLVDPDKAPVHDVIHRGADIDLRRLMPIVTCHERDAGPYITSGLVNGKNLQTGKQNLSINRMQVHAPNRLGILMLPRDLHAYFVYAESIGEPLPVTVTIGHEPLTELASQAIAPRDLCELHIAGALHGEPLRVTRSCTNDVIIPADAEFSIEGRILPHVRAAEGPFGEFPKYYTGTELQPVIEVDCITHRTDPIYRVNNPSGLENVVIGGVPREVSILGRLKLDFPDVLDVRLTTGGLGRYHMVVQMRKRQHGSAKNVLLAAFGTHYDLKAVVVVDEDVDIDDPAQVEWALATRFQGDRDLIVVEHALGSKLDPSGDRRGLSAKVGIDATVPLGEDDRFYTSRIPATERDPAAEVAPDSTAFHDYIGH